MSAIQTCDFSEFQNGYGEATWIATKGQIQSSLFRPTGSVIGASELRLSANAAMSWEDAHGDEALYVIDGSVSVDGEPCGRGTAIVIESEARPVLTSADTSVLYHVLSSDTDLSTTLTGSPLPNRVRVHITPPTGHLPVGGDAPELEFYADSFCDTCRIAFYQVAGAESFRGPSHLHSEDELIHVIDGELRVGPTVVPTGTSLFVPRERRYGFQTNGAFRFLNYRRGASMCTMRPGSPAFVETGKGGRLPDSLSAMPAG